MDLLRQRFSKIAAMHFGNKGIIIIKNMVFIVARVLKSPLLLLVKIGAAGINMNSGILNRRKLLYPDVYREDVSGNKNSD